MPGATASEGGHRRRSRARTPARKRTRPARGSAPSRRPPRAPPRSPVDVGSQPGDGRRQPGDERRQDEKRRVDDPAIPSPGSAGRRSARFHERSARTIRGRTDAGRVIATAFGCHETVSTSAILRDHGRSSPVLPIHNRNRTRGGGRAAVASPLLRVEFHANLRICLTPDCDLCLRSFSGRRCSAPCGRWRMREGRSPRSP